MLCSTCKTDNPADAAFCEQCGSKLELLCPGCKAPVSPGARFCKKCGIALEAPPAAAKKSNDVPIQITDTPAAENIEGERKTVTALFADIKGSTELMEDIDPEEARAIIDPALKVMIEAVKRYDGYVVQSTGDGIFALFGAPAAFEDHPQRAIYAALQLHESLREYSAQLLASGGRALDARVGIHTGEVVMRIVATGGKTEYTPIGHTANLASRLQTLAPSGSIAISDPTRRLAEGYFTLRSLGPAPVKGLSEPIAVHEVTGLGPLRTHFELSARRGLTPFVGREHELQQLARALELVRNSHGQLIAVVAEAGSGKSRLFHELKATLPSDCKLLAAYSVSHGRASAWLPVLELLRRYFGLLDTDGPSARRDKIRTTLYSLDPALSDTLPYLFGLLGIAETPDPLAQMDPRIRRARTLDAIKRILIRESLLQPLVVVFEDLHWIDSETQGLLDLLADSIANARLLMLVNYRPEYRHEWSSRSHYLQLRLDPLPADHAAAMLAVLLSEDATLPPLKRLIAERAAGNPFFIEEIVQALFDDGALARNGAITITRPLNQLRLPPTVQGILAARIDRLAADQKDLLQTLAVIGREAPLALIAEVTALTEPKRIRLLAALQKGEFIYEQSATTHGYLFKHALTQEVAYNSLLIESRKVLHERIGNSIESLFADRLDDHLNALAFHYSHSANTEKAIEYLGRAGQQALVRSAYADSIDSLGSAINLLQRTPDRPERIQREILFQHALGTAWIPLKGYAAPEVERAYTRMRALCERSADHANLFQALFGLWMVHYLRADMEMATDLAEQLLKRARDADQPTMLLFANAAMGDTSFSAAEFLRAKDYLEAGLALFRSELYPIETRVSLLVYAAGTSLLLGYPDQALAQTAEASALARSRSEPYASAWSLFNEGRQYEHLRQPQMAQTAAENLITLATEHGYSFWLAQAIIERGGAIAAQGRSEEGIGLIREGLAALPAAGPRAQYLYLLVIACMRANRLDEAQSALREALAAVAKHKFRDCEAELHRVKGELLLMHSSSKAAEAENCFRDAITIASAQSAKFWELRATTSLARLLASSDRCAEAYTMLSTIYNWFTEGFDTADLKDAKALLDELSA
jgi:class 3 adenylate cyclase/predicted ATPase